MGSKDKVIDLCHSSPEKEPPNVNNRTSGLSRRQKRKKSGSTSKINNSFIEDPDDESLADDQAKGDEMNGDGNDKGNDKGNDDGTDEENRPLEAADSPSDTEKLEADQQPEIESVKPLDLVKLEEGTLIKITNDLDSFTVVSRLSHPEFVNSWCWNGTMEVSTKLIRIDVLKDHRISYQASGVYQPAAYGGKSKPKTVNLSKLKQVRIATGHYGDIKFHFYVVCNDCNKVPPTPYMEDEQLMVIVGAMNMARLMKGHRPNNPDGLSRELLEDCAAALRDVQPFTANYAYQTHVSDNQTTSVLESEVSRQLMLDFVDWIRNFADMDPAAIALVAPPGIFGLPTGHEHRRPDYDLIKHTAANILENASFLMQAAGIKHQLTWHIIADEPAPLFEVNDLRSINQHMHKCHKELVGHMYHRLGGQRFTTGPGEFVNIDIGTNFSLEETGSIVLPAAEGALNQTIKMMEAIKVAAENKGEFSGAKLTHTHKGTIFPKAPENRTFVRLCVYPPSTLADLFRSIN
jgi:hypothetical protein